MYFRRNLVSKTCLSRCLPCANKSLVCKYTYYVGTCSTQCDQMVILVISWLWQQLNLPNSIKIYQRLLKCCQRGAISPILVTYPSAQLFQWRAVPRKKYFLKKQNDYYLLLLLLLVYSWRRTKCKRGKRESYRQTVYPPSPLAQTKQLEILNLNEAK